MSQVTGFSTSHFVSPTGLINSIPRSKASSIRMKSGDTSFSTVNSSSTKGSTSSSSTSGAQHSWDNRRGGNSSSHSRFYGGGSMLAAESFQKAYKNGEEPRVRRRSFEEAGHFISDSLESAPSISPTPPLVEDPHLAASSAGTGSPFMCTSIPALSAFTNPGSSAHSFTQKMTQNMTQTGLACRQKFGPVASNAAGKAKAGMAEIAVIASEVYRQECRSDNRGADTEFFVEVVEEPSDF